MELDSKSLSRELRHAICSFPQAVRFFASACVAEAYLRPLLFFDDPALFWCVAGALVFAACFPAATRSLCCALMAAFPAALPCVCFGASAAVCALSPDFAG